MGHNSGRRVRVSVAVSALLLSGCDSGTYTLYRNSVLDTAMRIHVATFDEASGDSYNGENCRIASELFAKQSGVTVRYWCEKGRYRK